MRDGEWGRAREDLHAGLRVGVVRGLEAQLLEAEAREEGVQRADEVAEREAAVAHEALDLVKLREVRAVDGLVAEDAVDGEELGGPEAALRELVEHARGHCRGVCAQKVLLRLRLLPVVAVPAPRALGRTRARFSTQRAVAAGCSAPWRRRRVGAAAHPTEPKPPDWCMSFTRCA